MAKKLEQSITPETLAKFKEKITELHHDLSDWLDGIDVICDEFFELEDMTDENLGTHLSEYADKKARALAEEYEEMNK